jgi:hypothetical protein
MVRFLAIAALIAIFPFVSGDAKTPKQVCRDRCVTEYKFCLKRTLTDKGRADCKIARKQCRDGCGK